jgi:hypothetical protein
MFLNKFNFLIPLHSFIKFFNILKIFNHTKLIIHSLSIKAAAPIPVPMHIETIALFAPVLFISGNKVAICLDPKIIYIFTCAAKRMA